MKHHTKPDPLNPTEAQRVAAYAARYELAPSLCTVDGSQVTDDEGFSCWVLTLAEVKDAGLWHDPADRFNHGDTIWVIFPL